MREYGLVGGGGAEVVVVGASINSFFAWTMYWGLERGSKLQNPNSKAPEKVQIRNREAYQEAGTRFEDENDLFTGLRKDAAPLFVLL